MLYYDRMYLSVVIHVGNSNSSKKGCFNHGVKFQDLVCNSCHDLTMLCLNIRNISIITTKGVD